VNRIKPRSLQSQHLHKFCLLSLVLILLFVAVPVMAENEGVVKGSIVNIREGPGLSYKATTQVEIGQVLTILEEKGNWFKVSVPSGQVGWISQDYLQKISKKVVVSGTKVNLRKGPGTNYQQVGEVKAGQTLSVLAEQSNWYKVWIAGSNEAWIASWLVTVQNSPSSNSSDNASTGGYVQVSTNVLNVRSGPGTGSALVTKIGLNEQHPVLETKNGWYKIKVKNMEGWVSGEYVKFIPGTTGSGANNQPVENSQPPASSQPTGQVPSAVIVTGNVVNIRQWNSLDAPVVDQVDSGDALTVLGSQGDWYQVRLLNGKTGWVANWLTNPLEGTGTLPPSRDTIPKKDVLMIPIAEGKSFTVIDNGGRPELLLKGWTKSQIVVKKQANDTILLELQGQSTRKYEGQIDRLGISKIKVYPQGSKACVELVFNFVSHLKIGDPNAAKETTIQVEALPIQTRGLRGKTIVLDPGHASIQAGGGLDPGAIGHRLGLYEKDVNLSIALKVKELLEDRGAWVLLTHTGSTNLTLAQRAGIANSLKADIFVSIHANSGKAGIAGHSTYYYAPLWSGSLGSQRYERQKLATLVQRELVKSGGRRDIGILEDNFAVLRETQVPSILVETAFLSDRTEEALLAQDWYRQKLAEGITNGIEAYFN